MVVIGDAVAGAAIDKAEPLAIRTPTSPVAARHLQSNAA
jgi:uroporphyrin-III C-methyltransferase / precorrin-2 dehydrogenase / sirohydrochlorin ferrochelatase